MFEIVREVVTENPLVMLAVAAVILAIIGLAGLNRYRRVKKN